MPVPGQEFGDLLGWMIGQAGKDIGEPGLRIDGVELGSLDKSVDGGSSSSALIGTGKGPVVTTDSDAAQGSFGGIVGEAEPPVIEETGKRHPTLEAVIDGFRHFGLG